MSLLRLILRFIATGRITGIACLSCLFVLLACPTVCYAWALISTT